jgi:signal transduction histidine kinase
VSGGAGDHIGAGVDPPGGRGWSPLHPATDGRAAGAVLQWVVASGSSAVRRGAILLGLVYLLGYATSAAFVMYPSDGLLATAGVALLGVVGAGCFLAATCRPGRRGTAGLLLVLMAVGTVENFCAAFTGVGAAFVVAWAAPFVVGLPAAAAIVLAATGSCALVLASGGAPLGTAAGIGLGILFTGLLATAVQQLLAVRRQTDIAAEARAGAAVLAERQRMAREMHDLLAHTLSAQIVHLEGARMLLERGDRAEQARRQVVGALRLAREGLQETTRALAALRGDELRVVERLSGLVADFRAAGGSACELDAGPEPSGLGIEARWAIVRTAQEALTNVHKHADGAEVVVRLAQSDRWCELRVTDSGGRRGALAETGAGYGLTGMRERAELIGGSLEASPSGDGFRVRLRVPLDGAARP